MSGVPRDTKSPDARGLLILYPSITTSILDMPYVYGHRKNYNDRDRIVSNRMYTCCVIYNKDLMLCLIRL